MVVVCMRIYYIYGDKTTPRKITWHQIKGGVFVEENDGIIRKRSLANACRLKGISDIYKFDNDKRLEIRNVYKTKYVTVYVISGTNPEGETFNDGPYMHITDAWCRYWLHKTIGDTNVDILTVEFPIPNDISKFYSLIGAEEANISNMACQSIQ